MRSMTRACSLMPITLNSTATSRCSCVKCTCPALGLLLGGPVEYRADGGKVDADQPLAGHDQRRTRRRHGLQWLQQRRGIAIDLALQCHRAIVRARRLGQGKTRHEQIAVRRAQRRRGGAIVAAKGAMRRQPGRWRDLIGHAIVQGHQLELVMLAHQAQRRHAQAPPGRLAAAVARWGICLQQALQRLHAGKPDLHRARPSPRTAGPARRWPAARSRSGASSSGNSGWRGARQEACSAATDCCVSRVGALQPCSNCAAGGRCRSTAACMPSCSGSENHSGAERPKRAVNSMASMSNGSC